jgi:mono/diheme cytochrome c family protein
VNEAPATTGRRGRGCGCWIALLVILLIGGGVTTYLAATFALRQEVPLEPEAIVADVGKRWVMVPAEFTDWQMPAKHRSEEAVQRGKQLFDAECAFCHGAGARGDAPLGQAMFPPAVALNRERTQSKTSGQLYWLIAHGLNYTGMPAWGAEYGGPHEQDQVWELVAYVESLEVQR